MICVSIKEEMTASIQIAFLELELDDLEGCFQPRSFCDSLILVLQWSILNHLIFISFIPFCFTCIKKKKKEATTRNSQIFPLKYKNVINFSLQCRALLAEIRNLQRER